MKAWIVLVGLMFLALGVGVANARPCGYEDWARAVSLTGAIAGTEGPTLGARGFHCHALGNSPHASGDFPIAQGANPETRDSSKKPGHAVAPAGVPGAAAARFLEGVRPISPSQRRAAGRGDLLVTLSRLLL